MDCSVASLTCDGRAPTKTRSDAGSAIALGRTPPVPKPPDPRTPLPIRGRAREGHMGNVM